MYFAIDPALPDLPLQIAQALAALRGAHLDVPLHVFALIDSAFDEALLVRRNWSRQPKLSLYEGSPLQKFGKAAPHLLAAPASVTEQSDWLQRLFAACAGKPMVSIIASTLPAAALQAHFLPYLVARTADGMEWPVRWGDTRVLPGLLDTIEAGQREHLLSPLHAWWSVQRNGTLIAWPGAALPAPTPADFGKQLPLSDTAFASLVDEAEADAVLANLHDTQPDLLQQHSRSACHARVAKHLAIADRHGIRAAGERQHFSVLALCLGDHFAQHPAMAALLQRTRQGADYTTELKTLPDSFWQESA